MLRYSFFILCTLTLSACVDEITFEPQQDIENLVVIDGLITDTRDPIVRITQSRPYDQWYGDPIQGASVSIIDGEGIQYELSNEEPAGVYSTTALRGEVDESYQLIVQIGEDVYESSFETLKDNVEMLDLHSVYVEKELINGYGNVTPQFGMQLYTTIDFHETNDSYVRWEYRYERRNSVATRMHFSYNELYVQIESSLDYSATTLSNLELDFIPKQGISSTYSLELFQYSISPEAYNFWKQVRNQIQNTGSIFDAAPGTIVGNVRHVDGKPDVVGIFSASSVKIGELEFTM